MAPSWQHQEPDKKPAYKPSGRGGVEAQTEEARKTADRIVEYELKQERFRQEEDFSRIQEQLDAGQITEEEARKLVARAKLHQEQGQSNANQFVKLRQTAMAGADYNSVNMLLEAHLDKETDVGPFMEAVLRQFRLYEVHVAAEQERRRRKAPDYVHRCPRLVRVVKSTKFDIVIGLFMVFNGLLIGAQASYTDDEQLAAQMDSMQNLFTFAFIVEVALRIAADGWPWIWDKCNFGDTCLIVGTGVLPMLIIRVVNIPVGFLRGFGVLRLLRLIRLIRMVRTYPMFRIFWALVQGVLDSGRTLLYTYIVFAVILYIFAIFAVSGIARRPVFEDDSLAQKYFGDLPSAMFTFFQIVTLDEWAAVARPLMKKSSLVAPLIIIVIMIATLALLNLIIAVIVHNAFQRAKQDEDFIAEKKRQELQAQINDLMSLFSEMDEDESGWLSKEEYEKALATNDSVIAKFDILEIMPSEYQDIWNILDDGAGEVSMERFAETVRAMKGDAKAKDSFSILRRVQGANDRIARLNQRLAEHRSFATDLRREATQVRQQLGELQHEMCDFIALLGQCVPARSVEIEAITLERFADKLHDEVTHIL